MQHIEDNLLDQYALGSLPAEAIPELEEHLIVCSFCQTRLMEADELLILLREAVPFEKASPQPLRSPAFRYTLWSTAAIALTVLLTLLFTGDSHRVKLQPAVVLMQSLRGPEAAAEVASSKPVLLVFDLAVQANPSDYEVEVVDPVGNEVLKKGAELRDGHLAVLVDRLARGSYWVRLYRQQLLPELMAEYQLRAN
jgi:anti-sigma factor RsiW